MKKIFLWLVVSLLVFPVNAQLFTPESFQGAAVGGLAGGIIGHNSGRRGGEGAAIGALAGFVLGGRAGQARQREAAYCYPAYPQTVYVPIYVATPAANPAPAPVTPAPTAAAANPTSLASPMAGANALFGR